MSSSWQNQEKQISIVCHLFYSVLCFIVYSVMAAQTDEGSCKTPRSFFHGPWRQMLLVWHDKLSDNPQATILRGSWVKMEALCLRGSGWQAQLDPSFGHPSPHTSHVSEMCLVPVSSYLPRWDFRHCAAETNHLCHPFCSHKTWEFEKLVILLH